MQIFQYGFEHKMYIVNKYTNLITFVVFRGYPIGRIFYAFLYQCPTLTLPLRSVFICLLGIMAVINMMLFWRLCNSDIFLTRKRKCDDKNGYKVAAQSWPYQTKIINWEMLCEYLYILYTLENLRVNMTYKRIIQRRHFCYFYTMTLLYTGKYSPTFYFWYFRQQGAVSGRI